MTTLLFLLLLFAAPSRYTVARTDKAVTQPTVPTSAAVWGGAVGAGRKWCNPAYNNLCIWRLTDSNTFPGKSAQTTNGQNTNIVSGGSNFVIVSNTEGSFRVVAFNKLRGTAAGVGPRYSGELMFKRGASNIIFMRVDLQIMQLLTGNGWQSSSQSLLFDFATCLPSGFKETWRGDWDSAENQVFASAYSDRGGQGSGEFLVAWDGKNCSYLNTATGQVWKNGALVGEVDDGKQILCARFYIHDGGQLLNPKYAGVTPTIKQPDGQPGCIGGVCLVDAPYIWEIGTTHLRPCYPHCTGHGADGYWNHAANKVFNLHPYPNPATATAPLMPNIPEGYDIHGSWLNDPVSSGPNGTTPPFITSTIVSKTPITTFTMWGQNEVFAEAIDFSGTPYRFGQHGNSGMSKYYICQNAKGTVSPAGDGVVFTSDMGANGALGYEADGVTPRCDVFFIEAK